MKKIIALALAVLMLFSLCACGRGTSNSTPSKSSSATTEKTGLSESEIKSATASALHTLISNKYKTADAGSCKMEINKIEPSGKDYIVYGTVWLYDKYGKLTTGWTDGSGTSHRSFEIKINGSTGTAYYGGTIK